MTLDIGLSVATGGMCFGDKRCVQGDVLYLALEDGDRRLQRRGSKLLPTFSGTWPANFHYATEWPQGKDGLAEIEKWVEEHPKTRLVVVDILAKFRVASSAKRGAYEQDYEALSGLQRLAQRYGITIIVVHHTRKAAGEDPVDEISGTLGLAGAVDAFMVIKTTAQGKLLHMRGRDIEEQEFAVKFIKENCKWEILGEPEVVQMSEKARCTPMSPCSSTIR
jgi:RecA-family ATPase